MKKKIKILSFMTFLAGISLVTAAHFELVESPGSTHVLSEPVVPRDPAQDRWDLLHRLRSQDTTSTELTYIKKPAFPKKGNKKEEALSNPKTSSIGIVVGKGLAGQKLSSKQIKAVITTGKENIDFAKPHAVFLPDGQLMLNTRSVQKGLTLKGKDADQFLAEIRDQMKAQRATYRKWYSRLTPKQKEQEQKSFEIINTELGHLAKLQEKPVANAKAIKEAENGIKNLIKQMNKDTFDQAVQSGATGRISELEDEGVGGSRPATPVSAKSFSELPEEPAVEEEFTENQQRLFYSLVEKFKENPKYKVTENDKEGLSKSELSGLGKIVREAKKEAAYQAKEAAQKEEAHEEEELPVQLEEAKQREGVEEEQQEAVTARIQQLRQKNSQTLPRSSMREINPQITRAVLNVFGKDDKNVQEASIVAEGVLLEDTLVSSITAARAKNNNPQSLEYRVDAKRLTARIKVVVKETKNIFNQLKESYLETITGEIERQMQVLQKKGDSATEEEVDAYDRLQVQLAICKYLAENESIVRSLQRPKETRDIIEEPQVTKTIKSVLGKSYSEMQSTVFEVLESDGEIRSVVALRNASPDPKSKKYKQVSRQLAARVKLVAEETKVIMNLLKEKGGTLETLNQIKANRELNLSSAAQAGDTAAVKRFQVDLAVCKVLEEELTRRSQTGQVFALRPVVPKKKTTLDDLVDEAYDDYDDEQGRAAQIDQVRKQELFEEREKAQEDQKEEIEAVKARLQEALKKTLEMVSDLDDEMEKNTSALSDEGLNQLLAKRQEQIHELLVQTFGENAERWHLDPYYKQQVAPVYNSLLDSLDESQSVTRGATSVPDRDQLNLIETKQRIVVGRLKAVLEDKLAPSPVPPKFEVEERKEGNWFMRQLEKLKRKKPTAPTRTSGAFAKEESQQGAQPKRTWRDLFRLRKSSPKVEKTSSVPVVFESPRVEPVVPLRSGSVSSEDRIPVLAEPVKGSDVSLGASSPVVESYFDSAKGDPFSLDLPSRHPFYERERAQSFALSGEEDGDLGLSRPSYEQGSLKKEKDIREASQEVAPGRQEEEDDDDDDRIFSDSELQEQSMHIDRLRRESDNNEDEINSLLQQLGFKEGINIQLSSYEDLSPSVKKLLKQSEYIPFKIAVNAVQRDRGSDLDLTIKKQSSLLDVLRGLIKRTQESYA